MTSRGQTARPISTIFNRLLEGTINDIKPKNEVTASKIVEARVLTDRHTDRHTDRQTDRQTERQTDRHRQKEGRRKVQRKRHRLFRASGRRQKASEVIAIIKTRSTHTTQTTPLHSINIEICRRPTRYSNRKKRRKSQKK